MKKADQTHLSKHSRVSSAGRQFVYFFLCIFFLTLCLGSSRWLSGNEIVQYIGFAQETTVCSVLYE